MKDKQEKKTERARRETGESEERQSGASLNYIW